MPDNEIHLSTLAAFLLSAIMDFFCFLRSPVSILDIFSIVS